MMGRKKKLSKSEKAREKTEGSVRKYVRAKIETLLPPPPRMEILQAVINGGEKQPICKAPP